MPCIMVPFGKSSTASRFPATIGVFATHLDGPTGRISLTYAAQSKPKRKNVNEHQRRIALFGVILIGLSPDEWFARCILRFGQPDGPDKRCYQFHRLRAHHLDLVYASGDYAVRGF